MPHPPSQNPVPNLPSLLRKIQFRLDSLYSQTRASEWGLTRPQFATALQRSAAKHFGDRHVTEKGLEEYFETLHIDDLVVATACMHGSESAWEYFVQSCRPYLRASAGAITRNSRSGTDAREFADSLFAELYGLVDGKRDETSLLRYFHGRSSLKTWLRTVLAQRHVDQLRQSRRWEPLKGDDGAEKPAVIKNAEAPPRDPHRGMYLQRFLLSLTVCVAALRPEDRQRLELYYAREKTLAEIGRILGEHESSVSRNLERVRRELRENVEAHLRAGNSSGEEASSLPSMSDAEIALCFEYAAEDAPVDFRQLFPEKPSGKRETGRKESS